MNLKKKKERERVDPVFLLFILSLLLISCTPNPIIIERNITINRTTYVNNTIYINDTIPCNLTCHEPEIDTTIYDRDYVLSLIRQLKHYEKQQDKYWNDSECHDDLNRTEFKLEECEDELCDYNLTWC